MGFLTYVINASILTTLTILSSYILLRWFPRSYLGQVINGLLYGAVAIVTMSIPMTLQPGVIFDGRSVVLSIGGLFGGGITALISALIAGVYRYYLGGGGTFTGIGSVVISVGLGLILRHYVLKEKVKLNTVTLLLFGFVTHLVLMIWFLTLPWEIAIQIYKVVSIPYLIVFPLATMLLGLSMEKQKVAKKTEKDLVLSKERYQRLVETLNEGIWSMDNQYITQYVNPAMADMLGYAPEEMLGRLVFDFMDDEEKKLIHHHLEKRKKGYKEKYEFAFLKKTGEKILVLISTTPIFNENRQFAGSIAAVQDITNRKKAEIQLKAYSENLEGLIEKRTAELRKAQEELLRKEKLAAMGAIAGGIAHEIRNPLAVISNSVFYLQSVLPQTDEKVVEYFDNINSEIEVTKKIVNDLLSFTHIGNGERSAVSINALIEDYLDTFNFPENIQVSLDINESIPLLTVDRQQIGQALQNLINNACQAMPDGGELTISADQQEDKVEIIIKDTGIGIPKDHLDKIFEPLFTTKEKGIGLGLTVTKMLVEANLGEIRVESQVGVGTTFKLSFPASTS